MDGNKKTEKRYRNLLMFSVSRYNIVSYSVIIVYLSGCLATLGLLGVLLGVPVPLHQRPRVRGTQYLGGHSNPPIRIGIEYFPSLDQQPPILVQFAGTAWTIMIDR